MAKKQNKTDSTEPIQGQLMMLPLDYLYLDPNNYRFIDNDKYIKTENDKITDNDTQTRTINFLAGKNREGLEDLLKSFKSNGLLPVEHIQVEKLTENQFRVIEGNRRVAALKMLQEDYRQKYDIGKFQHTMFMTIPVVVYPQGEEINHQIIMGLKHINGNKKWPPLNQAQLLKDLSNSGLSEEEISDKLGIGRVKYRKSLRALALIDEYRKSDYGDKFETAMFAIFEETVNKPNIRAWLDWNDTENKPKNAINTERFFSWISDEEVETTNEEGETESQVLEKIITKSSEIRELANFIDDPKALATMESSRSISQAFLLSDRVGRDKFSNALNIIEDQIDVANKFSGYGAQSSNEKVKLILNKFRGLAISKGMIDVLSKSEIERRISVQFNNNQFTSLKINKHRKLKGFEIKDFNRINIFGGNNNTGKSTILEAIYFLTKQNDVFAILEQYRKRGKFLQTLPSKWVYQQLKEQISIEGEFDGKKTSFEIIAEEEFDISIDKSSYVGTIQTTGSFAQSISESQFRLFMNKEGQANFLNLNVICNSIYSSPYLLFDQNELLKLHEKSVEKKLWGRIVDFIVKNIDKSIVTIDLTTDEDLARFYVNTSILVEPLDLTSFGDGMQRIVFLTMQFALCENGVLLIDELENAIHYSLLVQFSKLIEELAAEFNVQVFITSHSKECIEAFLKNGSNYDNITFYNVSYDDDKKITSYSNATRKEMEILIKTSNADLREK